MMFHQMIPPEIQEVIKTCGETISLQSGETLFRQGDSSDAVYLVLVGKLSVQTQEKTNIPSVLLNYIMPGELAGEIGAITGWVRTATLVADRPTTLVRLSQKQLQEVLRKAPTLAKLIMSTTSSHLVSADAERANLGRSYQQMRMRVCTLDEEKEQLLELLRLREEMEAMLVHDLRNPINVLQTGLTLLAPIAQETEDQETARTIIELMEGSLKRMLHLTDMLLDITQMEAGKANLCLTEFNMTALLSTLLNEQTPQFKEKNITLVGEFPLEMMLIADRDVLARVLVNLLDNAFKFTPDGGRVILGAALNNEHWIEVTISDSGPGIPPEERERVFEKFTQLKSVDRPPRRRGSGLGLTFCRMAIEAHGGRIWIESGPNDIGSTFKFKLPCAPTED
ncbi:MAG: cyclic nucleotide-binding domain-containing protein [Anaerolineae bacterium]|nr:cyclic nucleotide-binding domain-containing protein [Anaerolineae bacterium]